MRRTNLEKFLPQNRPMARAAQFQRSAGGEARRHLGFPEVFGRNPQLKTTRGSKAVVPGLYLPTDLGPCRATHVHGRSGQTLPYDVHQLGWPSRCEPWD